MDRHLRSHLIAGLGASILFTILTGVTAIVALQVTTTTTVGAARELDEDLTLVLHLRRTAQSLGSASRRYLVTGEDQHQSLLSAAQTEFEAARDRVRTRATRHGSAQLTTIERDAEDYSTAIRQARYEQWAEDPRKALVFFDNELRPKRTVLETDADVLVRAEEDSLHDALSRAERLTRRAQWTLAFTSALGIGLALAFAAAMIRELARESGRTRSALDAARLASASRRDLITVSHELRGELDAIVAVAAPTNPRDQEYDCRLATIAGAAERIRQSLDDLDDVSRIEAGTIVLQCEQHDASALVEAAIEPFQARAAERAIRIQTESPAATTVYVSRERIVQVLSTLIEDAVTLARIGGEITVRTTPSDGGIRFTVADTGPEPLPRQLARLFHVSAPSRSDDDNASLLLCKRIIEAHRGRFGIDRGTNRRTAWFTIPTQPRVLRAP